jgi:hypothetical protein
MGNEVNKRTKPFTALIAIALIGAGVTACGSAGKGTTAASTTATSTMSPAAVAKIEGLSAPDGISTFGHEATGTEKQAITALVKRFYAAAAADDGAKGCSLIYSILEEAVAEDYGKPPGPPALKGKTCAVVMSKLFKRVPGQPSAVLAKTQVISVRVKGREGFVLLHSSGMPIGEVSIQRERGTWKLDEIIGRACSRCAMP